MTRDQFYRGYGQRMIRIGTEVPVLMIRERTASYIKAASQFVKKEKDLRAKEKKAAEEREAARAKRRKEAKRRQRRRQQARERRWGKVEHKEGWVFDSLGRTSFFKGETHRKAYKTKAGAQRAFTRQVAAKEKEKKKAQRRAANKRRYW
jgi:hypothetical protein